MVTVKFYSCGDDFRVVDKTLTGELSLSCDFWDDCNIEEPTLICSYSAALASKNYAYIPEWGRYYFMTPPTIHNGAELLIDLKEDYLMSWKTPLKNTNATIVRSAQNGKSNLYLDDGKFKVLNYPRIQTKKFPNSLNKNLHYVLTLAGGGVAHTSGGGGSHGGGGSNGE